MAMVMHVTKMTPPKKNRDEFAGDDGGGDDGIWRDLNEKIDLQRGHLLLLHCVGG